MILIDKALEAREAEGKPIRVGIVGAGYMGRGIALQILTAITGMNVVAISNRTISEAERAYNQADIHDVTRADTVSELETAISKGAYAITDNAMLLCEADGVDAIIESTGEVEFGAHVTMKAIEHGKHIILMNAELDALVGPILKVYADRAGVIISNADGDQPGVTLNLFRFVKTIGYRPVLAGNLKGMLDHYRTPETQKAFAERYNQKPRMITSFADGTKIAEEMAVIANATGFNVMKRGMYGPTADHVNESANLFSVDELLEHGRIDYLLGAEPGPGVFVIGYNDDPIKQSYMPVFKMGEGPLYVFYTPYHLPHLETPLTVARAVLFNDAATAPIGAPVVDVVTTAKRDLKSGEVLDGIGGFTCYGLAENSDICNRENLLPIGVAEDCRLKRDIPKDDVITYDDVELPSGRLMDKLRKEQQDYFKG